MANRDFGRVAVLMGGTSSEREISLMTGKNVLEALLRQQIDAYAVDVGENIVQELQQNRPDRAFIALHGAQGEDGIIQGLLELLSIPYTSSGVAASALTMDKQRCNLLWQASGLPVLPFAVLTAESTLAEVMAKFQLPLCVKPASGGSSCGVSKVTKIEQLMPAYELAKQYDSAVMVEPWIEGREFTIGILGKQALPAIEITTPEGFYDYEAKYFKDNTGYLCPCDLPKEQEQELQQLALQAFQAAGCRYWSRVDFIQDREGKFWLLELNTIPGLTSHSLVPKAANQLGIDFDTLVYKILEFTL